MENLKLCQNYLSSYIHAQISPLPDLTLLQDKQRLVGIIVYSVLCIVYNVSNWCTVYYSSPEHREKEQGRVLHLGTW